MAVRAKKQKGEAEVAWLGGVNPIFSSPEEKKASLFLREYSTRWGKIPHPIGIKKRKWGGVCLENAGIQAKKK